MSDQERRQRIEALIAKWQERLRLQDWDIFFSGKEPSHNRIGEVEYIDQAMVAEIRLGMAVPEQHEEAQVLHEVLEIVTVDWQELTKALIKTAPIEAQAEYTRQLDLVRHRTLYRLTCALLGKKFEPYSVIEYA